MQTKTPCTDYIETKGLIYFARMLDKIRLKARGELPPDYFTGVDEDPTMFDARCTRFLDVNYDELVERTLKGGSDEEILEWCFELSLIHISEPTRLLSISYAVFCLKKKKK